MNQASNITVTAPPDRIVAEEKSIIDRIVEGAPDVIEREIKIAAEDILEDAGLVADDSSFDINYEKIAGKRFLAPRFNQIIVEMISVISSVLNEQTKIPLIRLERSLFLIAQGESSLKWPPPIVERDGEIRRFGTFQLSVPIIKELEALYQFKFMPLSSDSHIYLSAVYFHDIFFNADVHMDGDWSEAAMAEKFPQFVPYVRFNNETDNKLFGIIAYHRAGFCPSAYASYEQDVENEILSRLPVDMFLQPHRKFVEEQFNMIQRHIYEEQIGDDDDTDR